MCRACSAPSLLPPVAGRQAGSLQARSSQWQQCAAICRPAALRQSQPFDKSNNCGWGRLCDSISNSAEIEPHLVPGLSLFLSIKPLWASPDDREREREAEGCGIKGQRHLAAVPCRQRVARFSENSSAAPKRHLRQTTTTATTHESRTAATTTTTRTTAKCESSKPNAKNSQKSVIALSTRRHQQEAETRQKRKRGMEGGRRLVRE